MFTAAAPGLPRSGATAGLAAIADRAGAALHSPPARAASAAWIASVKSAKYWAP